MIRNRLLHIIDASEEGKFTSKSASIFDRELIWSLIMSVMITLALCSSLTALAEYGWRIHQRAEENEQDCQHNMDEGLWFFEKWRHMKWLNDWLRVFSQTSSTVFPESKEFIESLHARDLLLVTCFQTSKSIWNTENNEINYTGQNQNFIGLKLLSSRQPQKSFRWLAHVLI